MNKKLLIKTAIAASVFSLCTLYTVSAEYISDAVYNYDTGRIEVNGKFFEKNAGQYARILILKDGANIDALSGTDVDMQDEVLVSEDGTFNVDYALRDDSADGKYTVIVKVGNTEKSNTVTYDSDISEVLAEVLASKEACVSGLKGNAALGLDAGIFSTLSEKGKEAVANKVFEAKADDWTAEDLKSEINKAAVLEAIKENKLSKILDGNRFIDPALLGLDSLDKDKNVTAYVLYNESLTEAGQKKVIEKLVGNEYGNSDAFLDAFVYNTTIAAIKYNKKSGTSHIKQILTNNNSVNGFDLVTNYNNVSDNSIDLLLLKGKEWAKDDIQEILDTKVEAGGNKQPSSEDKTSPGKPAGGYSVTYPVGGDVIPTPPEPTGTFTDLDSVDWAREAIETLAEKSVVSGRGDGTYAPMDNVTRAEFISLIVRALGLTADGATCDFADVKEGDWSYEFVAIGSTLGITSGYGNGYFGAADNITRQDAAVMLNNAVTKAGLTLETENDGVDFADKAEISDYAAAGVDTLVKAGILSGADGNFMPKKTATRAEAAVMLAKLMTALGLEG